MTEILAIAAGGAIGAVARHLTVLQVTRWFGLAFPYGTLAVNVAGSLILGLLLEFLTTRYGLGGNVRTFFVVGVLGSYTTFSSFSLEVIALMERHAYGPAAVYVLANVLLSVGGLFGGLLLARAVIN